MTMFDSITLQGRRSVVACLVHVEPDGVGACRRRPWRGIHGPCGTGATAGLSVRPSADLEMTQVSRGAAG